MAKASFILSLIAGIFVLINGLVIAALGSVFALIPGLEGLGIAIAIIGLIFGVVILVGASFMNNPKKLATGSILVLVFSILAIFIGGGFLIGTILGIIGGALGLAKK